MRGDYIAALLKYCRRIGSSPLTRGLRDIAESLKGIAGIIPAHAGTTHIVPVFIFFKRDHPRSRGDYTETLLEEIPRAGSSPLTRGLQIAPTAVRLQDRIIPAHEGTTRRSLHLFARSRDHPRSRGDYFSPNCGRMAWLGSSPLTRGLPIACAKTFP